MRNPARSDDTIWNAASYVRLSREDGDKEESDSIGNQKELIRSFIKGKSDIQAVSAYEDDGYSGIDYERPSFKRMIADIQDGKINCVIVKDLSRLGRNYIETGRLLERFFPFMGVRFIAINDSYDSSNHNSQTDNLLIPFKNLINDAYCADISNKIRSQFEVKRQKGDFIGSFAAFGYQKDPQNKHRLVIDETAAAVVRDIFKWKMDGMSQQSIADRLNAYGVPSPLEYKKSNGSNYTTTFNTQYQAAWSVVAVARILKNDLYTGVLTQGISTTPNYKIKQRVKKAQAEWVRIEQAHDPIISVEDFSLVAGLLLKDTRIASGGDSVYLFSGMLVCPDCGRNLVRKNVPSGKEKYVYHICSTYKKGDGCTSHSISDSSLHDTVFETLKLHIRECAEIGRILEFIEDMPLHRMEAQRFQNQIEGKQAEIDKLESRMVKLYEDFQDGLVSKTDYMRFNDVFSAQARDTVTALEKLTQEHRTVLNNSGDRCLWIEHFKRHHNMQYLTRSIVVELIDSITIYDKSRIEVSFRYQENFNEAVQYIESLPTGGGYLERAVS